MTAYGDGDNVDDIRDHYNSDPQREDRRLDEHQLEYELTWRYLVQYLPDRGSILEIGAGTGRYSLEFAKRGYEVTALDLSPVLIEQAQRRTTENGLDANVRFIVADARDLSEVTENAFDAVVMLGPLYHLILESDRKLALRQAFDRLRAQGTIFSAFLSRFGVLGDLLKKTPAWIEDEAEVQWLLERGRRPDDYPRGKFRGYFAHVSEIAPLHESVGFRTEVVAGIEPAIAADDESFNRLQGAQRQLWLDLLYAISTEPSILGASRHFLYIGKKPR